MAIPRKRIIHLCQFSSDLIRSSPVWTGALSTQALGNVLPFSMIYCAVPKQRVHALGF